ncbi:MAG: hypothetical protein WAP74_01685 [Patescibacteria group bacterium]
MKYAKFCRIAFIVAFALIAPCSVAAQDFSTVPDFPSDFTLIDPKSATPSPSPSPTPTPKTTAAVVTKELADTPTGPGSLAVVTLATLLGLLVLGIIRWHSLTAIDHDHQN